MGHPAVPASRERSFYVSIASLLLIAVCALWRPVPGVAWDAEGMRLWALRLLQASGVWLSLRSVAILDIRELAGLTHLVAGGPQASGPEFRTTGPYGWVRHPIYAGWFLMVLAAAPMTMTRLVFAGISCAYLLIAIPFEERSMRAEAAARTSATGHKCDGGCCPGCTEDSHSETGLARHLSPEREHTGHQRPGNHPMAKSRVVLVETEAGSPSLLKRQTLERWQPSPASSWSATRIRSSNSPAGPL